MLIFLGVLNPEFKNSPSSTTSQGARRAGGRRKSTSHFLDEKLASRQGGRRGRKQEVEINKPQKPHFLFMCFLNSITADSHTLPHHQKTSTTPKKWGVGQTRRLSLVNEKKTQKTDRKKESLVWNSPCHYHCVPPCFVPPLGVSM